LKLLFLVLFKLLLFYFNSITDIDCWEIIIAVHLHHSDCIRG